MFEDFISVEMLATFAGLVAATNIIVQFSKKPIKNKWGDAAVRIYSFIISFILIAAFIGPQGKSVGQSIILILINSIIVTLTALGSYESIADPKAEKKK